MFLPVKVDYSYADKQYYIFPKKEKGIFLDINITHLPDISHKKISGKIYITAKWHEKIKTVKLNFDSLPDKIYLTHKDLKEIKHLKY